MNLLLAIKTFYHPPYSILPCIIRGNLLDHSDNNYTGALVAPTRSSHIVIYAPGDSRAGHRPVTLNRLGVDRHWCVQTMMQGT